MSRGRKSGGAPAQSDAWLITKKQVFSFKPVLRLEKSVCRIANIDQNDAMILTY
jgi:hypothetical protein